MPHLTPADAARLLSEVYNLSASEISALPGEYDLNFRVRTADGQGYVLKVMHPSRALPEIDLQCRALLLAVPGAAVCGGTCTGFDPAPAKSYS